MIISFNWYSEAEVHAIIIMSFNSVGDHHFRFDMEPDLEENIAAKLEDLVLLVMLGVGMRL